MKNTARCRFTLNLGPSIASYPPGATFGPRRLNDHLFVWIIEGDAECEVDNETYPAPPGTIILARPGMSDFYRWDRKRQTRHAYLHFNFDRCGASLPRVRDWPVAMRMPEDDIIRPLFRHLAWLRNDPGSDPELIQGAMRQIFLAFITGAVHTSGHRRDDLPDAVERVFSYLQDLWKSEPLEPPTLENLARAAACSAGHLCRLFGESLGVSPMQAVRLARLHRAAQLLAGTNLRVQEVAARTGFESPFHFSRTFKEVYGAGPRAFRRQPARRRWQAPPLVLLRQLDDRLWRGK